MAEDIAVLDGAIPLIRGDQPWEWFVSFFEDEDEAAAYDLTGKTVQAEIRWKDAQGRAISRTVTATITDAAAGEVTLSLSAAQTMTMPFGRLPTLAETASTPSGRLPTLFIAVVDNGERTTWARAAIEVKEGHAS